MSIPRATITNTGVSVPTTDEVKNALFQLFESLLGSDMSKTETSPQGQLIVSLTAVLQDRDAQLVNFVNQTDPQYSTGIWQEGVGKIYFITRHQATYSTAQVTFIGLNGTIIPEGFQLQDSNGYYWKTTSQLIIDSDGKITGNVQCTTSGTISASNNSITIISTALSGLDRVSNENPSSVGSGVESREDFEIRRSESVAKNSKMTDQAIRGEIANLDGVVDVWVRSNYSDDPTTFGSTNYPVDPHAICISVVGGNDYDIAWAALVKGGTGASFMGNTNPTVYDRDTYLDRPVPYTTVKFIRPTDVPYYIKITLAESGILTPSDQNTIKDLFVSSSASGKNRSRIAQYLIAFQYCHLVSSVAPDARVLDIKVSLDNKTWKDAIEFGVDQFPVCPRDNISFERA